MIVEVKNLSKRFGDLHAVQSINFHMNAGEVFGFIGPNGAGKTTTMRILATLEMPTRGDAFIDGHSVSHFPEKVRSRLGLMPDYHGVYNNMDIADYLDFFARAYRLRGRKRRERVDSVVDFVELGPLLHKPVTTLSKGMRQRLSVGRMLINDPDVLIMDEPTAGLDPRARIEFRELIKVLAAEGKAIMISSHILSDLSDVCTRVAIIERGEIVATGTMEEVHTMAHDRRSEAKGVQNGNRAARILEVEVLKDGEKLETFLTLQPDVSEIRHVDHRLEALYTGDDKALTALLQRIVQDGFAVKHFSCRFESLEDIFMTLTEGKLQ